MEVTIRNDCLSLVVDTFGAQLLKITSASGTEYLWNGDAKYWSDCAPVLFPFVGRLYQRKYRICGEAYSMPLHGFAMSSEFALETLKKDKAIFLLEDNQVTHGMYPFCFQLRVCYELKENTLAITYLVNNTGDKVMPFGIGGHPGFRIPFVPNTCFEDYYLRFHKACTPDRVGFTDNGLLSNHDELFSIEDKQIIRLRHELFDNDGVILKNIARTITLGCVKSNSFITVSLPGMPYLGIWHTPHSKAPFVCIEPWMSLPGRQSVIEDFDCKSDLVQLSPGASFENTWTIKVSEDEKRHPVEVI